ncbi:MAG: hypothetical protein HY897_13345 [Deltaproteobacteria bacterium]|nr:hypothetical protein [Deltaproteobacteria bacterium]
MKTSTQVLVYAVLAAAFACYTTADDTRPRDGGAAGDGASPGGDAGVVNDAGGAGDDASVPCSGEKPCCCRQDIMYSGPYPCIEGEWRCPDGWYEACEPFPNEYCNFGYIPDAGTDTGIIEDTGTETDAGPKDTGPADTGCHADCTGKFCGQADGCGGVCTACLDAGEFCDKNSWQCKKTCTPDCTDKYCGDGDGCGGKCAACLDPSDGCNTSTWLCEACSRNCGSNGHCVFRNGAESCKCDPGYHIQGAVCAADTGTPCEGVTCSGRGTCKVQPFTGIAECECDAGYAPWGKVCSDERWIGCRDGDGRFSTRGTSRCDISDTFLETCRDSDGDGLSEWAFGADCVSKPCSSNCLNAGCDVQPCPLGTSCVTEAHGQPLFSCVVTCDCSNCGNCDMEDFVQSGAMQAQCGSPDESGPTMACRLPCPFAGHGCIPYSPPICWGLEGCMSAAPAGP